MNPAYPRKVFGSWSGQKLIYSALDIKQKVFGGAMPSVTRRPEFWGRNIVSTNFRSGVKTTARLIRQTCSGNWTWYRLSEHTSSLMTNYSKHSLIHISTGTTTSYLSFIDLLSKQTFRAGFIYTMTHSRAYCWLCARWGLLMRLKISEIRYLDAVHVQQAGDGSTKSIFQIDLFMLNPGSMTCKCIACVRKFIPASDAGAAKLHEYSYLSCFFSLRPLRSVSGLLLVLPYESLLTLVRIGVRCMGQN
jgi:hypothetical protein